LDGKWGREYKGNLDGKWGRKPLYFLSLCLLKRLPLIKCQIVVVECMEKDFG